MAYSQNDNRFHDSDDYFSSDRNLRNVKLEHGKAIKLLRNGDEHFSGQKVVINSKKYREFDYFLDDLSRTLNARFGAVRNIHTPNHGHIVKSFDEFEEGKAYVATGTMKFKRLKLVIIKIIQ